MYADLGLNVVAADLDPQVKLTRMFLEDDRLEALWGQRRRTIFGAIRPLLEGSGDVTAPYVEEPAPGLGLVAGDLALSAVEDELSRQWQACLHRKPRAFRVLSALRRVLRLAAMQTAADIVLVDVGPNLGAFNRAALVAADDLVVPIAPDLCSLQGLRNLDPTLRRWRNEWAERRARRPVGDREVPAGTSDPSGTSSWSPRYASTARRRRGRGGRRAFRRRTPRPSSTSGTNGTSRKTPWPPIPTASPSSGISAA